MDIVVSENELRDAARLARESVVVANAVTLARWIGTGRRPVTAAQVLRKAAGTLGSAAAASPAGWIAAHLALGDPGDYVSLQLYLPPGDELATTFQGVQGGIRNATRLACTVGFGPRFLHSTGQLHKGGPNTGVFLQITSDGGEDLAIWREGDAPRLVRAA